ncbi:PHP domain-like protein [Hypoxylon sp. NC1633]|nr:PHP domain-like protein [Hypoxylon sp. NC1633]
MLYDLNIAWSPSTSAADLERTLRFSSQLGYNVVALNRTLDAPLKAPMISNPLPKFPASAATTTTTTTTNSSSSSNPRTEGIPSVLHRLTVRLSDPAQNPHLAKAAQAYDILAVRPQTEKAFVAACLNIQDASVISIDLSARLPYNLKPKPCMTAVARGLRFEIAYGLALDPALGADARARACFAGNVTALVRATRGRGIIVSSEAASAMALRAPADLVNLLAVWGLPTDRGFEALGAIPRGVVMNEGIKRRGFRGVVDIVSVAERSEEDKEKEMERRREREKEKQAAANHGKKRKNQEGENPGDGNEAPMSKRQAKKLQAALRKKEAQEKAQTAQT